MNLIVQLTNDTNDHTNKRNSSTSKAHHKQKNRVVATLLSETPFRNHCRMSVRRPDGAPIDATKLSSIRDHQQFVF